MTALPSLRLDGKVALVTGASSGLGAHFAQLLAAAGARVVDRCVQILGGQGVTAETPVMRIFMDMRAFRIYDGPSEVHRWSMARKLTRGTGASA